MKNPLQNLPVRAVRLALGALFASLAALAPSAAAHSPQAVDAQGNACIQVDCAGDKITNRCNFPVQLTSQCKGGGSLCIITGAFNSETAGTAGKVKVLGTRDFGTEWERALLRVTDFYPKDISRTNISGGGREQFFGYACAVHTDGSVESAGGEWHKDDNGNSVFVCVHNHTDGQGRHTVRPARPDFECPGERINNWAAECVEYKSYQSLTRGADGTENFAPAGHADGTYLVNNCKCPVVLDSCHGKHPCHQDANRQAVLQPGEDSFVAALPGSEASWAACYRGDRINQNEIKSVGENLWTCGKYKTECSEVIAFSDDSDARLQFEGISRVEAVVPEAAAEAQEEGGPTEAAAEEDPLAALRGTPPPTGTKTEKLLRKKDVWGGQLDVNARVSPEGWAGNFSHLHFAALENDMEAARWLIANGAEVNAKNSIGGTPLHDAAGENAGAAAKLLIDNGAEVNAKNRTYDLTPLHTAASFNAADVAKVLIDNGAEVSAKNKSGQTPLHLAAFTNAADVAKVLIANGAEVNAKAEMGETPLHLAAFTNAADVAKVLIDNGAEVNAKGNNGGTPLHLAAVNNAAGAAKILFANGAEVNVKNKEGGTPMDFANHYKHGQMQSLLRQHGGRCNLIC